MQKVAEVLQEKGVAVFYDRYEDARLWGEDLSERLASVYGRRAKLVVLFISSHYAAKAWTNHERQSAQVRALADGATTILPVRFDDTEIPGLSATVGYVDARSIPPEQVATKIVAKLAS